MEKTGEQKKKKLEKKVSFADDTIILESDSDDSDEFSEQSYQIGDQIDQVSTDTCDSDPNDMEQTDYTLPSDSSRDAVDNMTAHVSTSDINTSEVTTNNNGSSGVAQASGGLPGPSETDNTTPSTSDTVTDPDVNKNDGNVCDSDDNDNEPETGTPDVMMESVSDMEMSFEATREVTAMEISFVSESNELEQTTQVADDVMTSSETDQVESVEQVVESDGAENVDQADTAADVSPHVDVAQIEKTEDESKESETDSAVEPSDETEIAESVDITEPTVIAEGSEIIKQAESHKEDDIEDSPEPQADSGEVGEADNVPVVGLPSAEPEVVSGDQTEQPEPKEPDTDVTEPSPEPEQDTSEREEPEINEPVESEAIENVEKSPEPEISEGAEAGEEPEISVTGAPTEVIVSDGLIVTAPLETMDESEGADGGESIEGVEADAQEASTEPTAEIAESAESQDTETDDLVEHEDTEITETVESERIEAVESENIEPVESESNETEDQITEPEKLEGEESSELAGVAVSAPSAEPEISDESTEPTAPGDAGVAEDQTAEQVAEPSQHSGDEATDSVGGAAELVGQVVIESDANIVDAKSEETEHEKEDDAVDSDLPLEEGDQANGANVVESTDDVVDAPLEESITDDVGDEESSTETAEIASQPVVEVTCTREITTPPAEGENGIHVQQQTDNIDVIESDVVSSELLAEGNVITTDAMNGPVEVDITPTPEAAHDSQGNEAGDVEITDSDNVIETGEPAVNGDAMETPVDSETPATGGDEGQLDHDIGLDSAKSQPEEEESTVAPIETIDNEPAGDETVVSEPNETADQKQEDIDLNESPQGIDVAPVETLDASNDTGTCDHEMEPSGDESGKASIKEVSDSTNDPVAMELLAEQSSEEPCTHQTASDTEVGEKQDDVDFSPVASDQATDAVESMDTEQTDDALIPDQTPHDGEAILIGEQMVITTKTTEIKETEELTPEGQTDQDQEESDQAEPTKPESIESGIATDDTVSADADTTNEQLDVTADDMKVADEVLEETDKPEPEIAHDEKPEEEVSGPEDEPVADKDIESMADEVSEKPDLPEPEIAHDEKPEEEVLAPAVVQEIESKPIASDEKPEDILEPEVEPAAVQEIESKPEPEIASDEKPEDILEPEVEPVAVQEIESKPEPVMASDEKSEEDILEPVVEPSAVQDIESKPEPEIASDEKSEDILEPEVEPAAVQEIESKPEPEIASDERLVEEVLEPEDEPAAESKVEAVEAQVESIENAEAALEGDLIGSSAVADDQITSNNEDKEIPELKDPAITNETDDNEKEETSEGIPIETDTVAADAKLDSEVNVAEEESLVATGDAVCVNTGSMSTGEYKVVETDDQPETDIVVSNGNVVDSTLVEQPAPDHAEAGDERHAPLVETATHVNEAVAPEPEDTVDSLLYSKSVTSDTAVCGTDGNTGDEIAEVFDSDENVDLDVQESENAKLDSEEKSDEPSVVDVDAETSDVVDSSASQVIEDISVESENAVDNALVETVDKTEEVTLESVASSEMQNMIETEEPAVDNYEESNLEKDAMDLDSSAKKDDVDFNVEASAVGMEKDALAESESGELAPEKEEQAGDEILEGGLQGSNLVPGDGDDEPKVAEEDSKDISGVVEDATLPPKAETQDEIYTEERGAVAEESGVEISEESIVITDSIASELQTAVSEGQIDSELPDATDGTLAASEEAVVETLESDTDKQTGEEPGDVSTPADAAIVNVSPSAGERNLEAAEGDTLEPIYEKTPTNEIYEASKDTRVWHGNPQNGPGPCHSVLASSPEKSTIIDHNEFDGAVANDGGSDGEESTDICYGTGTGKSTASRFQDTSAVLFAQATSEYEYSVCSKVSDDDICLEGVDDQPQEETVIGDAEPIVRAEDEVTQEQAPEVEDIPHFEPVVEEPPSDSSPESVVVKETDTISSKPRQEEVCELQKLTIEITRSAELEAGASKMFDASPLSELEEEDLELLARASNRESFVQAVSEPNHADDLLNKAAEALNASAESGEKDSKESINKAEEIPVDLSECIGLECFTGGSSWMEYFHHFETFCRKKSWTKPEKGAYLFAHLKGRAKQVACKLPPEQQNDYDQLVATLGRFFTARDEAELYLFELRNRVRKPKEGLRELGTDVRRLTDLAYPEIPVNQRIPLARIHFLDALKDSGMLKYIYQYRADTLEHAIRLGIDYEGFKRVEASEVAKAPRQKTVEEVVKDGDRSEMEKRLAELAKSIGEIKSTLGNADKSGAARDIS